MKNSNNAAPEMLKSVLQNSPVYGVVRLVFYMMIKQHVFNIDQITFRCPFIFFLGWPGGGQKWGVEICSETLYAFYW